MSAILSYKGTVYPWHCDHMGHIERHVVRGEVR